MEVIAIVVELHCRPSVLLHNIADYDDVFLNYVRFDRISWKNYYGDDHGVGVLAFCTTRHF